MSSREIGRTLGIARSTVQDNLARASAAGLTWPLGPEVSDAVLEQRLFARAGVKQGMRRLPEPDWPCLVREMRRPGVNLMVLWEAYREAHPEGYGYSRFCDLYREFERRLTPVMRQHHAAGDKVFVDYSGKKVDYRSHRGLDRALFLKLATGDWIRTRRNLVITGPCGVGKSWLACALGHKACRDDLSVLYYRVPRLFAALSLARGDGRYGRLLRQIAKANLLILDDWGPEPLLPEQARDLLEIIEDRYDAGSTLITSQVPVDRWYEIIGIPTLADAVLDRLLHNAHRIELAGESLRKRKAAEPAA